MAIVDVLSWVSIILSLYILYTRELVSEFNVEYGSGGFALLFIFDMLELFLNIFVFIVIGQISELHPIDFFYILISSTHLNKNANNA